MSPSQTAIARIAGVLTRGHPSRGEQSERAEADGDKHSAVHEEKHNGKLHMRPSWDSQVPCDVFKEGRNSTQVSGATPCQVGKAQAHAPHEEKEVRQQAIFVCIVVVEV